MDTFKADIHPGRPDGLEKGSLAPDPFRLEAGEPIRRPPSISRRHWIVFGVVIFIWFVFSYGQLAFYGQAPEIRHWVHDGVGHPPPSDGNIDYCVGDSNWTTYYDEPSWSPDHPYGAEAAFSLPVDSDALFLNSRGALQGGLVTIKQSKEVSDTVDVRVRVAYSDQKTLRLATVCQLERAAREYGVGIFTPPVPRRHCFGNGLEFDIAVTLPAGNEDLLQVKKLETRLLNYNQNVAALGETVHFDEISLTSANGRISVQSVTSEVGRFLSVNGEVDGQFNVRSSLELNAGNGRVTPTVNMLHREGQDPTYLVMHTANGQIDAEIALTSEASTGGEFEVDARSTHGGILLKFTDSPVDSILRCFSETTVGSVQVELDRAFEGSYSLESLLGAKVVSEHDVEDPAGRGRHRVVSVSEARGRVDGEIKWVDDDASGSGDGGNVMLKSVTSSVRLTV